jgi:hypothetical protein
LDIKREPPKKTKKYIAGGVALLGVLAISAFISRLRERWSPSTFASSSRSRADASKRSQFARAHR